MTHHAADSDLGPAPHDAALRSSHWAATLAGACDRLARRLPLEERNQLRATAWPILRTVLAGCVRQQVALLGPLSAEAVDDVAAEKALDLLLRCESGSWNPTGWSAAQLAAFLSRVARNGVVDQLRALGPRRMTVFPREETADAFALAHPAMTPSPAARVESGEYARHLIAGIRSLKPRARIVWLLRVCFDWPSRRIADHPEVRMPASHVDVELQRTRGRMRVWMESAGFDVREMPPGTFAALWSQCVVEGTMPVVTETARDLR